MANSNMTMFKTPLGGNKYDLDPTDAFNENVMANTTIEDEDERKNWLKSYKPAVFEKMQKYPERLKNGESIAIIQFQYDYLCNFDCEHCCIDKFYVPRDWERASGRRKFELDDVRRLSKEADEMGLANFVITGGEPLLIKEYDELVEAIDPSKFYLASDSNGWLLDFKKAKHLKSIGIDKIQLSLDGADPESHDTFRRKKGSWARVMRAIDACRAADLHVILSTVIWKDRIYSKEWKDFLKFCQDKQVGCYVVYAKPVGAYEGVTDQMMTEKEGAILQEFEEEYDIFTHMTPSYGRDLGCIAVKRMIPVTRYGDILPCPYTHVSLGNFFEEPLKKIIDRGLNVKWFDPKKNMPCVCGVDKSFLDKVTSKTYGDAEVPVMYDQVFDADDYIDKNNMGTVKKDSGIGLENESWKNAPAVTIDGADINDFLDV